MRIVVGVAILWTAVVVAVLLLTPSLVSPPGCASAIEPSPGCQVLTDAGNQLVWVTQTRPIVILSVGGYVAIAILAIARRSGR